MTATYRKTGARNLLMWSDLTLDLLRGQTRIAKFKSAFNSFIISPRGLQCETNLLDIMGWESPDVVRLTLGPSFKDK